MTYPTAVEAELARQRRTFWGWVRRILGLGLLFALILAVLVLIRIAGAGTPGYKDVSDHFKYGSIGSETASGIPERVWLALPHLFPEYFGGRTDYAAFGFLYDDDRELPIGISQRTRLGVDLVWFNCALCHAGTYRADADADPVIVLGMPSNNMDLGRFINTILAVAADPRMAPEPLMQAMKDAGVGLGWIDRLIWRVAVFPALREGLIAQAAALQPLMDRQPTWGKGRVDTFNPYKLLEFGIDARALTAAEVIGASDFPSIFLQAPREGMQLHWDGNNDSLAERNLSAALGAGVTPETVAHGSVERVAFWLEDLQPPPSPYRPDAEAVARGRETYMENCAACHGYQGQDGYVFKGESLGKVEPIDKIGTDRARLDSYTEEFSALQKSELFAGTDYAFTRFQKTNGYANGPLDGLWLRAPYLHNGSVPTLADLLEPPEQRPITFLRDSDILDPAKGGFEALHCTAGTPNCYDTHVKGNSNSGHVYGTDLAPEAKADLLAYLLTF
ncbi:MAG: c-type cytochrome [Pseudomonadota bacterium]